VSDCSAIEREIAGGFQRTRSGRDFLCLLISAKALAQRGRSALAPDNRWPPRRPYEATLPTARRCRAAQESDVFWRETEPQEPVIIDLQEPRVHTPLRGVVAGLEKPAREARLADGSGRRDCRHTLSRELYGHDHHLRLLVCAAAYQTPRNSLLHVIGTGLRGTRLSRALRRASRHVA